ncbi:MAG TPA: hypothetical protein VFW11_06760 [Cyclobacteriaceae bacterium]|nr:hypothetical protein [Cyclobacteriaceae bacterium]
MQAQQFDQTGKYAMFQELLRNNPKADQMHYLVSTAAMGYVRQLNEWMPDVVNVYGAACVPFNNFKFELIQSRNRDKNLHVVQIDFYSEWLTWIGNVGDQLIFGQGEQLAKIALGDSVTTDTMHFNRHLSICCYRGASVSSGVNNFLMPA